jgi:hypothetical protein
MSSANSRYPACLERPDLADPVRVRTPKIEAAFRKRFPSLRKRAARFCNNSAEDITVVEVAVWLFLIASTLRPSDCRQYRACVSREQCDLWDANAISLIEVELVAASMLLTRDKDGHTRHAPRRPFQTSAGRAKGVCQATATALARRVAARNNRTGKSLAGCHEFGPKAGLRKCEWEGARLKCNTLTIPCGKFSIINARAIASHRTQMLNLDAGELARLHDFLEHLQSEIDDTNGRSDLVMRRMGHLLRTIRNDVGAPRLTLKTLRHQFTANMRAAGYSQEETAAALGHAAADTSEQHYGKRNRGWRGLQRWMDIPKVLTDRVRPGAKRKAKIDQTLALTRSESIALKLQEQSQQFGM